MPAFTGSAKFEKLSEKEQNKILKEELEYARTENAVLKNSVPWERRKRPQGKSGDSLRTRLPGLRAEVPAQGAQAQQAVLRVPCPEIPGRDPKGPAGGGDRGGFRREQGKIRRPPHHGGPPEGGEGSQPQEGAENHAFPLAEGKDVQEEKTVQLLQGRGRKNRWKPDRQRFLRRCTGPEVRHGRHGVQAAEREALPVPGEGPVHPGDRRLQHIAETGLPADSEEDG